MKWLTLLLSLVVSASAQVGLRSTNGAAYDLYATRLVLPQYLVVSNYQGNGSWFTVTCETNTGGNYLIVQSYLGKGFVMKENGTLLPLQSGAKLGDTNNAAYPFQWDASQLANLPSSDTNRLVDTNLFQRTTNVLVDTNLFRQFTNLQIGRAHV